MKIEMNTSAIVSIITVGIVASAISLYPIIFPKDGQDYSSLNITKLEQLQLRIADIETITNYLILAVYLLFIFVIVLFILWTVAMWPEKPKKRKRRR